MALSARCEARQLNAGHRARNFRNSVLSGWWMADEHWSVFPEVDWQGAYPSRELITSYDRVDSDS